jgi:dTDP-glucose 4,6-dehydratase
MRLLITGGCGFIGSNFIRYQLRTHPQYHLTNLDQFTYAGNLANVQEMVHHPHYRFVHEDICDIALVQSLVADV